MSNQQFATLSNGVQMPLVGLGTWQSLEGQVEKAVVEALGVGYRHIDAAVIYGNQREIAEGLKAAQVPRAELFIVSKLWCNSHRPELVEADLNNTLKELGLDYLDLYLIHWPTPFLPGETLSTTRERQDGKGEEVVIDVDAPGIVKTWKAMERMLGTGKVKAIGVSNFTVKHLELLAASCDVVPMVNQIEAHPLLQQPELVAYMKEKHIIPVAYSPLGQNITGKEAVINHKTVKEVAEETGCTPAQALIAWTLGRGFACIPKSVTPSRIQSNFQQVELSTSAHKKISDIILEEGETRYNTPFIYHPRWDINVFESPEEEGASRKVW